MKLSSEIETLLLCARYHQMASALLAGLEDQHADANQQAEALGSLLRESEGLLLARMGEVATRAGLIGMDHVTDDMDLGKMAALVFDKNTVPSWQRHGGGVVVLNPVNHDAELVRGALLGDPQALIRRGVRTLLYSIPANESVVLETMYGVHRDGRPVTGPLRRVLGLKQTAEVLGWRRDTTERRYWRALLKVTGSRADVVQHLLPYIDRQQPRSQDEVFLMAVYAT